MADSGVALHRHGQGEVGGGRDGDLTEGEQEGEHLGVPVISPHPQQARENTYIVVLFFGIKIKYSFWS